MEVAVPRTTAGRPGVIESPARRRAILALLVLVIVACLGAVALVVGTRGAGDSLGDRLSSLQRRRGPRRPARARTASSCSPLSREFATRFNTYDPDMLDDAGHLPDYAAVGRPDDRRSSARCSPTNVRLRRGRPSRRPASAASAPSTPSAWPRIDGDSAEVLVAGTIELSYPTRRRKARATRPTDDDRGTTRSASRAARSGSATRCRW